MTQWGASPEEWAFARRTWGDENLHPIVANPTAAIHPRSSMKALGKTPSRYDRERKVWGIGDWTSRSSSPAQVDAWSREPDYSVGVQTRGPLRAFDIDVDHPELALRHATELANRLGIDHWICRGRENSGRLLLPFRLYDGDDGSWFKSMKVEGGMIDMLGPGKQFVAFGTHPSGARYRWSVLARKASERYMRWAPKYDGSDLA